MSMPGLSVEEASTETHSGIQLAHDADLLIRTYVPSSLSLNQPYTGPPIPLPLCIPQVGVSPDEHSTFARGYNEVLNDTGIPQDVLLNFIDGLNMAIIASPPLRVVGTVGKVIGFIRRVAMTEGFALSLNIDDIPPPVKPDGVMDTMASWGVRFDTAVEKFSEKNNERRRRALQSIREANIEQPSSSMRLLETGSPTSSSASLPRPPSNTGRSGISSTSSTGFKNMASSALNTVNDWRLQREVYFEQQNTVLRNSRLGNVGILGHKKSRMEQKVADADLLEHWGTEKILWVVIMASDKDEEIENIGIAEDPADEEQIDDRTWRERMAVERDGMELEDLQKLQQQETHASVHASEGNS
ncbi:hypothetical protein LENED_010327 [Lentinula edodes]|uniref:Uncharacterized protein n=1 Tax=Lentinula edodes TaxID=5353 RepID=A0A1Q3EM34_LENED|nr:hypothetical protein LENED_010327 [Lentinula edodes]